MTVLIHDNGPVFKNVLLADHSNTAGVTNEFAFNNETVQYFNYKLQQTFDSLFIDNTGDGDIRITFNKPGLNMTSPANGAKTLKAGESIYIEETIWQVGIYYIAPTTVELILSYVDEV